MYWMGVVMHIPRTRRNAGRAAPGCRGELDYAADTACAGWVCERPFWKRPRKADRKAVISLDRMRPDTQYTLAELTSYLNFLRMTETSLFEIYAPTLRGPKAPGPRDTRLLMDAKDGVNIYYAPFEYINLSARIVLVGITPGPTQMTNANNEARRALQAGRSSSEAIRAAKDVAAFSGEPFRSNLIKQLNHWGFHKWLGLSDSSNLFSTARHLVQTTSLQRYPVFVNDSDYRGNPDMTKHSLLRKYLLEYFVEEVEELQESVFVGLGPCVQKVLNSLIQEGALNPERVIGGMLHPSGNCTYRINYLISDRSAPVPHATNPVPYDEGRQAFRERFL